MKKNKQIYLVEMLNEFEEHMYIAGLYGTVTKVKRAAAKEVERRGGKYTPIIHAYNINSSTPVHTWIMTKKECADLINKIRCKGIYE